LQWLTPVIPAIQEVEIGRITVRGQPWEKSMKLYLKNNESKKELGTWFK
jgi:hypothetical protein